MIIMMQGGKTVVITQYKWAGSLGPFRIRTTCDECDLTSTILQGMMEKEFRDRNVRLEIKPWLDNFFYCLFRGTWHPPIVIVNGRKFHQFSHDDPIFDGDRLVEKVNELLE